MIIELLSSLIISTNFKEENVNISNSTSRPIIVLGDSQYITERREQQRLELAQRTNREVAAREKAQRASGGGTVLEVIGEFRVKGGCVPYAWSQGMQSRGYGAAKNYPTTQDPQKFAITYEGFSGHAVVVEKDLGDKLQVRDANYITGKITRRVIPKSLVKGYLT